MRYRKKPTTAGKFRGESKRDVAGKQMTPGFYAEKNCASVYINTRSLARLNVKIPAVEFRIAQKGLSRQMRWLTRGIIEVQK